MPSIDRLISRTKQALLECYGLSENDWPKRRMQWRESEECALLTRLGTILDAAASYLRGLQPVIHPKPYAMCHRSWESEPNPRFFSAVA